ncbi:putative exported protein [hydrothermal vent metagenome]|uniref:Putative exported protein n=1 Tax=hydrothermal vent metagenome TaxID=652676 RepID=A0A1W1E7J7_9ZZZZ
MKKFIYAFLSLFVLLITILVVAANSSYVIKKLADMYAPDYNISYDGIDGNILTGVKIAGLKYEGLPLTDEITFSWNPSKLLYKRIAINSIDVKNVDIDTLKALAAHFSDDNQSALGKDEKERTSSSAPFAFSVAVKWASVSFKPFRIEGVSLSTLFLNTRGVLYRSGGLEVESVKLETVSSVGEVLLSASLKNRILSFKRLNLAKIDTKAIEKIVADTRRYSKDQTHGDTAKQNTDNPLIPKVVMVRSLHVDLLPAVFEPVHLHTAVLDAEAIQLDMKSLMLSSRKIDLNMTTNLSNVVEHGAVRANHFGGNIVITPHQRLYKLYHLPLRKKAIGSVQVDFNASRKKISVDICSKAKNILELPEDGEGNRTEVHIDIDSLLSHVVFDFQSKKLKADTKVTVTTPYTEEVTLGNYFEMEVDKQVRYTGDISIPKLRGLDVNLSKLLKNLQLHYKGTLHRVSATLNADALEGSFVSNDLKKGMVHLQTKAPLLLKELVKMPEKLSEGNVEVFVDMPVDFSKSVPLEANATLVSNLANINVKAVYGDHVDLSLTATMPKDSLLRELAPKVKWDTLSPMYANMVLKEHTYRLNLRTHTLNAKLAVPTKEGKVFGKVMLPGIQADIKGKLGSNIVLHSDIDDAKQLFDAVDSVYTLEQLPNVKGALLLDATLDAEQNLTLRLQSPQIRYDADRETEYTIDDLNVVLAKHGSRITLDMYSFVYNGTKLYANKPAVIVLKDNTLFIEEFWLNDQLKISGGLDFKQMKGEIDTAAQKFHISHEFADIDSNIDLKTVFNGNKTNINGKITLLGGNIHYDLSTKTFPSDSDIVIVQQQKESEENSFVNNLSMLVNIENQKPLVYKEGPVNVKSNLSLVVHKAPGTQPVVLGSIDIVDGSSYLFQGKRFVLEKSHIYLTGDPLKPLLDLKVKYKGLRHLITVTITGTPAVPNIMFSSVPSLSKEQILSIILFDSEEGAGTNDANAMMKMMGGVMAKSALNDLGVKIDHLVIGAGSIEVGKKLTDKITVIYINGEIPEMKMKYEYNPNIEVVIGASEKSESADIVYKKDFNLHEKDIVIKRR